MPRLHPGLTPVRVTLPDRIYQRWIRDRLPIDLCKYCTNSWGYPDHVTTEHPPYTQTDQCTICGQSLDALDH
jgi:hypothetical protein